MSRGTLHSALIGLGNWGPSSQKRFSEEQVIRIMREAESSGATVHEVCRKNLTEQIIFLWRIHANV